MLTLDPGTIVHDRYRILQPIGKGGMGAVYEAVDLRLHSTVALKQMTAEGPDVDRAFEQEAQLLASLRHGGLPAVIDYFIAGEDRFLVMQYIEGEDLAHVRKRRGGVCEERDVLAWGVEVLNTLSFLHRHEPPIVHRDVKPANLKLTPRGEILLLDFGLAKGGPSHTRIDAEVHSIYGFTANYAPPEQQQGRGTDARSDLYALGATLYHLVTGVVPAAATARTAAAASRLPDPLVPAHQVNSSVSTELTRVLSQALQLSSDLRFQTAEDMREALAALRDLAKETPRGTEVRGLRRIDAAMPSRAEVGRQIDLIVQVRFVSSSRLGLEDWPSKRHPEAIEQASEAFAIDYPVDQRTQRRLPARLRIRIVAPDFTIDGAAERLIEVPPEAYSTRLALLLTPRRVGLCRVNVEVYAVDSLLLGTVPIEADTIAASVGSPVWRVAHLVLGMLAREPSPRPPELFREPEASAPDMQRFDEALRVAARIDRESATVEPAERVPDAPRIRVNAPGEAAPVARAGGGLRKWMLISAPFAVLLTAVVVMQRSGPMSSEPPPIASMVTTSIAPAGDPAAIEARVREAMERVKEEQLTRVESKPALRPVTEAERERPRPSDPAATSPPASAGRGAPPAPAPAPPSPPLPSPPPQPSPGSAPPRPVESAVPPPPALTPPVTPGPAQPRPPATAISPTLNPPIASAGSVSHPNVTVVLASVERLGEVVRATLLFRNGGPDPVRITIAYGLIRLVSEMGASHAVVAHSDGTDPRDTFTGTLAARSELQRWLEFRVPDGLSGNLRLTVPGGPGATGSVAFPALTFSLPPR